MRPTVRRGEERFTSEARGAQRWGGASCKWLLVVDAGAQRWAGRKATPGFGPTSYRTELGGSFTSETFGNRGRHRTSGYLPERPTASSLGEATGMYKENPALWKHGAATCSTCGVVWVERGKP